MIAAHALELVALALALTGLLAVIAEILVKDPSLLLRMATDLRGMAEPMPSSSLRPQDNSFRPGASANSNEHKKAA
jgi:hypothetical protein